MRLGVWLEMLHLMEVAETKFATGEERKQYVIDMMGKVLGAQANDVLQMVPEIIDIIVVLSRQKYLLRNINKTACRFVGASELTHSRNKRHLKLLLKLMRERKKNGYYDIHRKDSSNR